MSVAYEGIRVIDFTQIEQGPVGTQVLADFGAEVIKIEPIGVGDRMRHALPKVNGLSCFFLADDRNKKSLTVNVKRPEGKELIYKLARVSDVVASNFRPGVMERLGFGFADLSKINSRIICAYASGYGQTGPYRDKQGQDLVAQAMGGLMELTGDSEGPPTPAGTWVADYLGGMLFALGITIALAARERTGRGQVVDSCLLNAVVATHLQEGTSYLNTGQQWPRPRRGLGHADYGPLYGAYRTRDDKWLVIVDRFVDRPWQRVCNALGLDRALADDPRFETVADLLPYEAELKPILDAAFAQLTREEAMRRLDEQGVLCGPVYSYPELFADPQVIHNEMVLETEHPTAGKVKVVGNPIKLSDTPGTLRVPPPLLGQHNEEILRALGYSAAEIGSLQQEGIVGMPEQPAAREGELG